MTITTGIFKTALGAAGNFFGGIQTYLIVGAVSAALAFGGGIWLETKISRGEIADMKLADQKFADDRIAMLTAIEKKFTAIDLHSAVAAQKAFDDLHVRFVIINKEIPAHVTPIQDARACISVGLARSLRGEADGTSIDALQLAEGQSDDDCSDVTASEVAGWFKAYAEASLHNATELTLLQADIKAKHDAQMGLQ